MSTGEKINSALILESRPFNAIFAVLFVLKLFGLPLTWMMVVSPLLVFWLIIIPMSLIFGSLLAILLTWCYNKHNAVETKSYEFDDDGSYPIDPITGFPIVPEEKRRYK